MWGPRRCASRPEQNPGPADSRRQTEPPCDDWEEMQWEWSLASYSDGSDEVGVARQTSALLANTTTCPEATHDTVQRDSSSRSEAVAHSRGQLGC